MSRVLRIHKNGKIESLRDSLGGILPPDFHARIALIQELIPLGLLSRGGCSAARN